MFTLIFLNEQMKLEDVFSDTLNQIQRPQILFSK